MPQKSILTPLAIVGIAFLYKDAYLVPFYQPLLNNLNSLSFNLV